jgi:hypothetical protein
MENVEASNLIELIENLDGEQRIFVPLDKEFCRHLKYLTYKKQAYINAMNSFLTSNLEIVNEIGYEKIIEDLTETIRDEFDTGYEMAVHLLGEELVSILRNPNTRQIYFYDLDLQRMVITTGARRLPCPCNECDSGSCSI